MSSGWVFGAAQEPDPQLDAEKRKEAEEVRNKYGRSVWRGLAKQPGSSFALIAKAGGGVRDKKGSYP